MTLEWRGGKAYYYRSVREGGKVRKEYVAAGEFAEALARFDETIRRIRALEREQERAKLEDLGTLVAPVLEAEEAAAVLARCALVAGGYRRHKGEWRRKRSAA
jgi:hypothetical protein